MHSCSESSYVNWVSILEVQMESSFNNSIYEDNVQAGPLDWATRAKKNNIVQSADSVSILQETEITWRGRKAEITET